MGSEILVHCCCGPCATSSVKRLIDEGWIPVLHFQNSNIYPQEENEKRWGELLKVAAFYNVKVVRSDYDHQDWRAFIKGLENEPEHGARCLKCFEYNLLSAQKKAKELGIEHFTTTLTVSRFKNSKSIFSVGEKLEGFEKIDFKKMDGFAKSVNISREMGLYRQQYCGCEFSMTEGEH